MNWFLFTAFWIRDIFKGGPELSSFDKPLSRETIITRGRILLIDDVVPPILSHLRKQGFTINHDRTGKNTVEIERHRYDVVILDFGGVGKSYGPDEGLSLLRHIRRVSPATFILAFTSLSLYSKQAEFYTLSDGILSKDAGIQEAYEKLENALRESMLIERHWNAILQLTGIDPKTEHAGKLKAELVKTLRTNKARYFKKALGLLIDRSQEEAVASGIDKILSLAAAK
jgi:DNA-binding NarL/FixJ family response regulator